MTKKFVTNRRWPAPDKGKQPERDYGQKPFIIRLNTFLQRVAGDILRAEESLLSERENLESRILVEACRIGGNNVIDSYTATTGGFNSKRSLHGAAQITDSELSEAISRAVDHVLTEYVTNDQHKAMQARRGRVGGMRSKRSKTFTLADFAPYAGLSKVEQMKALSCSESTIKRLRREYKDLVGDLPVGGSDKPIDTVVSISASPSDTQPEETTVLSYHYNHEDLPEIPDFLPEYTPKSFFLVDDLERSLRFGEKMTDDDKWFRVQWDSIDFTGRRLCKACGYEHPTAEACSTPTDFSDILSELDS